MNTPSAQSQNSPHTTVDPRLPKLANLESFNAYMATGWGTPDRGRHRLSPAPQRLPRHIEIGSVRNFLASCW